MSKVQFWIAAPTGEDHLQFNAERIGDLVRGAANNNAGYNALALTKEEAASSFGPIMANEPMKFFTITVEEVGDIAQ